MKKLLLIPILFFTVLLTGQVMAPGVVASSGEGGWYSDHYGSVYNAMTTPPTGDTLYWQDTLVYKLDSAGIWDEFDGFVLTAQTDNGDGEAQINWPDPGTFDLTDPGTTSPTWSKNVGFAFDGSSDYLSLNYNANNDSINYGMHDAHIMVHHSNTSSSSAGYLIGGRTTDNYTGIYRETDGEYFNRAHNTVAAGLNNFTPVELRGITILRRTGTTLKTDHNDETDSDVVATTDIPDLDFYLGAQNLDGTASTFKDETVNALSWGGYLDDTQVAAYKVIMAWYMLKIGIDVQ